MNNCHKSVLLLNNKCYQVFVTFQSDVFMVQLSGSIILLQSLDYETQRMYQISVNATVCDHSVI